MFSGQPSSLPVGDEELTSVGVRSRIGHRELHFSSEGHIEVLIGEFTAVDGHATGAVAAGKVATLRHKTRDDSVELASLVAEELSRGTSSPIGKIGEVLNGLGRNPTVESKHDSKIIVPINTDIKEHFLCHLRFSLELCQCQRGKET